LNYGNPEIPEQLASLEEGVRGISDASRGVSFDQETVPIISGNVSLYNSLPDGSSIPPSAIVCCIGVLPDARKAVTMQAKKSGSHVFLIGKPKNEDGEVTTKQSVVVDPRHGAVHEKPCHKCGGVVKTFIAQNGKPENVGKLFASCQGKDEQPSCGMFEWCDDSAPEPATMVGLAVEIPADQEEELKKFLDRIGGRISF
jgi:hypothetical protein